MGRTNRHEETGDRQFKKLKGRTNKRKRTKNKSTLSNMVTFRSQRPDDHIPNAETVKTMEELLEEFN